jgi:hypothetical protein
MRRVKWYQKGADLENADAVFQIGFGLFKRYLKLPNKSGAKNEY